MAKFDAIRIALSTAVLVGEWSEPWPGEIYKTKDGHIVYLGDGDSEIYDSRRAAIDAQYKWLGYRESSSDEERNWARTAQNIINSLAWD